MQLPCWVLGQGGFPHFALLLRFFRKLRQQHTCKTDCTREFDVIAACVN